MQDSKSFRTLLLENATEFSGHILLIEPQWKLTTPPLFQNRGMHDEWPTISFRNEKYPSEKHHIAVRDYIRFATMDAVFHTETLGASIQKHQTYFDTIVEHAHKEKLVLDNTWVLEIPDYNGKNLFPGQPHFLLQRILDGTITMAQYEKYYEISGFKEYIEKYFRVLIGYDMLVPLHNFAIEHTGPCASFLARSVQEYVKEKNYLWSEEE